MTQKRVVIIGIAGGSASGKSTISKAIVERVGMQHISYLLHDFYYRDITELSPDGDLSQINFDHPDSLDTGLMVNHLQQLRNWQQIEAPVYDFVNFRRQKETQTIQPCPIILVEGILVLAEKDLHTQFDIKIFVDTPADIRFIRRMKRDMAERGRSLESVVSQYMETVRPMHMAFVEPSKRHADVIVPQGGLNFVAVDMIADRIRGILASAE